ncbi:MAG: LamG-like jellyroll fold domain-containing protein [Chloroflexota bacterium]
MTSQWQVLLNLISKRFNLSELNELCFSLHIDPENLWGETSDKVDRIIKLIRYIERHKRISDFLLALKQKRPNEQWPEKESLMHHDVPIDWRIPLLAHLFPFFRNWQTFLVSLVFIGAMLPMVLLVNKQNDVLTTMSTLEAGQVASLSTLTPTNHPVKLAIATQAISVASTIPPTIAANQIYLEPTKFITSTNIVTEASTVSTITGNLRTRSVTKTPTSTYISALTLQATNTNTPAPTSISTVSNLQSSPSPTVTEEIFIPPPNDPTSTSTPTMTHAPTPTGTPFYDDTPLIVFTSERAGSESIYTMLANNGASQQQITTGNVIDTHPSWSPDGQWIVFSSNRSGQFEIYKMRWDGTDIVQLTFNNLETKEPSWTPNGQEIIYAIKLSNNQWKLYIMSEDGSNQREIVNDTGFSELDGSLSVNDRTIVYQYCDPSQAVSCEIYSMNKDGTNRINLTNSASGRSDVSPAISPDGTQIAYTSSAGNADIWIMDINGNNNRRLVCGADRDVHPEWSPDGTQIAFASNRGGNYDIYIIDLDAECDDVMQYTTSPANDFNPVWQSLSSSNQSPFPIIDLNDGLDAHYPFSGNANDISGNDNHLQEFGPSLTSDKHGQNNQAYFFDGDDYMISSFPINEQTKEDREYTISLWFNPSLDDFGPGTMIHRGESSSCTYEPIMRYRGSTQTLEAIVSGCNGTGVAASNLSIDPNSWHHFAFAVSEQTQRIYVDGTLVATGNIPPRFGINFKLFVGGRTANGVNADENHFYIGALDEIRIYSRVLSPIEIEVIYNLER